MNGTDASTPIQRALRELILTAWPALSPSDSAWQQRKKRAVRGGQSALGALVATAVLGTVALNGAQMSGWRIAALVIAGLVYWGWSVLGVRDAVRVLLWEQGAPPVPSWPEKPTRRTFLYFAVQLVVAAFIYKLGDQERSTPLLWLILLPPVAHAVILLPRGGVVCVSLASLGILLAAVVRHSDRLLAPMGLVLFVFALLFTVIFTSMVVGSERARGQVLQLASELEKANAQLREYAVQVEELSTTRERNRLAREIHDNLGHSLTVVNVQLEAARALRATDPDAAWLALEKAQHLTQAGLGDIRRSVAALRTSPLDQRPLPEALASLMEEGRVAGLSAEMVVLGTPRSLPSATTLTLYRTGQEGLTNARKHAKATSLRLSLDYRPEGKVRLEVCDDGQGAEQAEAGAGKFGLLGIRERVQLLGGNVRVITNPGQGFTLEVEVPG